MLSSFSTTLRELKSRLRVSADGRSKGGVDRASKPLPSLPVGAASSNMNQPGSPNVGSATSKLPAVWLPYTLRGHFFGIPLLASAILCIVVSILCWYSRTNYGLGKDDGTSILLFGWKFMPTLVAVLYTQLIVMLSEDVKRTEPFARLAKTQGVKARYTILQEPTAWWTTIFEGFSKKKNGGQRSWIMIWATLAQVLSWLAISPLSSSLLTSKDTVVQSGVVYDRIIPNTTEQLPITTNRDVYFRTIGNLLQNITTSAWLPGKYSVLPFWPSDMQEMPIGPTLSSESSTWHAETTVLAPEFLCETMTLQAKGFGPLNTTQFTKFPAIEFNSSDGCQYSLAVDQNFGSVQYGGAMWANLSTYAPDPWATDPQGLPVVTAPWGPDDGLPAMHATEQCGDREIILATTPWLVCNGSQPQYSNLCVDQSQLFWAPNFTARAELCETKYYMANLPVTVTLAQSETVVSFDESQYIKKRQPIPDSWFNTSMIQEMALRTNWTSYMGTPNLGRRDTFGGVAAVLGASYDFNLTAFRIDPDLPSKAATMRHRFFGELLLASYSRARTQDTTTGKLTSIETRIIVVTEIALTLGILFFIEFCLLAAVFWLSRLRKRPLHLKHEPSTTTGIAAMVVDNPQILEPFQTVDQRSSQSLMETLGEKQYFTGPGALKEVDNVPSIHPSHVTGQKDTTDWRPLVLQLRTLSVLIVCLLGIIAALIVLFGLAQESKLFHTAFVYQTDISFGKDTISSIAPYSILPTFLAVMVNLWWSSLDKIFRGMQPYSSMSRHDSALATSTSLTYQTSYLAWAAGKAALNRDWVLFLVTFGSTLCEVLTVSMSALFTQEAGAFLQTMSLQRTLEPRQIFLLSPGGSIPMTSGLTETSVIANAYANRSADWMYAATIQLTLNGSLPPWTHEDWVFAPVDLSDIPGLKNATSIQNGGHGEPLVENVRATVMTSGLRGRLVCSPLTEGQRNLSSWTTEHDLTNSSLWNVTKNPQGIDHGYELGVELPWYLKPRVMYPDEPYNTSILTLANLPDCCANDSFGDDNTRNSAVGYWSPINPIAWPFTYPRSWPFNITTKWILGTAKSGFYRNSTIDLDDHMIFTEPPSLQHLNCRPIVERVDANVTVDHQTGMVSGHKVLGSPQTAEEAWLTQMTWSSTNTSVGKLLTTGINGIIATSYGILFLEALLGAADLRNMAGFQRHSGLDPASWGDQTYNIKDYSNGLNVDLMTYSMLSLANSSYEALLDASTMERLAQKTFSTFFQHFAAGKQAATNNRWGFQEIGEELPSNLTIAGEDGLAMHPPVYHQLDTKRSVEATFSTRIQLLRMNTVATGLSVAILVWLVATTVVVTILRRRYFSHIVHGITTIAHMMVLISSSDEFLALVRNKGVEGLKREKEIQARLKWFPGKGGKPTWGIELVRGKT